MAHLPKRSNEAANTACDAMAALANSGKLRIYDGSQPANADAAIGGANLLAELTMNATAFGASVAGVATANAISGDTSADLTGTAAWFRVWKSNGTSPLWDGTVGATGSGSDLELATVSIVAAAAVNVTAFTVTESKG
jgi:hypothetical protein